MIPINVEIGLKINDKIEYIPLGIFNIDNVKKNDFTIKIAAYDNMSKFKIPYFSSLGDLATLPQVVNEISTKTGVQFEGSLPNYSVKKLEGFSCREVLGFVASLCGGNAIIKRNGKFTIIYPTDINRDIGEGYFDFSREEVKYKIGKITCKAEDRVLSKGSLGADSMELEFENPWATDSILNDVYNRLNGFEYLGYDLKWQGDPSLDIGDIITHKDDKGVIRKLPILNYKLSYDGGLDSELSAKGETKNKNSFDSSGSMKKKIDRVVTELAIVNEALIDVAYIGDLTAGNIKFDTASGGTLDLQSLLVKFVSGENGQYLNLTSSNVVIDNAVIKDAMIDTISASKINTGVLDTNLVTVQGPSGNLLIKDNTIQIKDSNRTRVQIGKDASNDYNMYVWDSTGKLMFDATGLKADGIKSKIIRDDMISDTANINGSKINISSLITEVNKDTNTQVIKASKIAFDSTGQSLEVSFNSLKSNVDNKESRNLALNTNIPVTFTGNNTVNQVGLLYNIDGSKIINKIVTVSFDFSKSEGATGVFRIRSGASHWSFIIPSQNIASMPNRIIKTVIVPVNGDETFSRLEYRLDNAVGTFTISNFKVEFGENTNPVWTVAPEDIDSKIQANTTSITAIQGSIDTLVKDTKIEDNGTVVKLQDFYSIFKQTSKDISLKVEGLETIEVQGRNLLLNSGAELDLKYWNKPESNGEVLISETDVYYGAKAFRIKETTGSKYQTLRQNISVNPNSKIAISGFVKVLQVVNTSSSVKLACNYYRADGSIAGGPTPITLNVTGDYKKIEYLVTIPSDVVTLQVVLLVQGAEALFDNIKVEKGLKTTGWTNAPEDIDTKTTTINNLVNQNKQNIRCNDLGAKINYSRFDYQDLGEIYLHGFDDNNNPSDTNGKIYWSGKAIIVPKGMINPNSDCVIGGDIYLFMNVTNQTVVMGTWYDSAIKSWKYKMFIGGTSTGTLNPTNEHVAIGIINMKDAESFNYAYLFETPQSLKALTVGSMDILTRMNSTELKITDSAITASVSNAINAGTAAITTTQFVMDTTGLTVKNGAIKIQNKAGATVLSADVNGNLSYTGKISNIQDGYGVEVDQGGVLLSIGSEIVGGIRSSKFTANTAINGISIVNTRDGEYIDLGFTDSETFGGVEFTPTIRISKVAHELTGNFKGVQFYDNIRVSSRVNMFVSNLYAGTTSVGEPAGRYYHNGWCGSIEGTAKRISNLNVFYDSGWYGFATGSNGSPVQYWGVMLHLKLTDNDFMQLVIGTDNKMYTRCWVNNAWQSWVQR